MHGFSSRCWVLIGGGGKVSLGARNKDFCFKNVKNIKIERFLIHSSEEHQIGSWIGKYGSLRSTGCSYKFGTH